MKSKIIYPLWAQILALASIFIPGLLIAGIIFVGPIETAKLIYQHTKEYQENGFTTTDSIKNASKDAVLERINKIARPDE